MQDLNEPGLNGVRVELYRDNGDGLAILLTDTLVGFTLTSSGGQYLFSFLPAGDYYAVFYKPPTYEVSPKDTGTAPTPDENDSAVLGGFVERDRFLDSTSAQEVNRAFTSASPCAGQRKPSRHPGPLAFRPRRRQFDAPTPRPKRPRATSPPARQENPRAHQSALPSPRVEDSELQPELSQHSCWLGTPAAGSRQGAFACPEARREAKCGPKERRIRHLAIPKGFGA